MIRATRTAMRVEYAIRDVLLPARQIVKKGAKLINLSIGDPCAYDFETPQHMRDALVEAVQEGGRINGYGSSEGLGSLRRAIVAREKRRNDIHYDPDADVCVTTGVSEGIQMLYAATLNPGDEVLVPGPCYPPYTSLAKLLNAQAVPYRTIEGRGWQPDIDDLRKRITSRTRAIVLINPNNPTGAVAGRRVLDALGALVAEHAKQLFLISDEIYDDLVFDVKHLSAASVVKDAPVVTFNGLSKVYLAPGWRVGWTMFRDVNGRLPEIQKGYMNQARLRLCASSIAQRGAVAALTGPMDYLADVIKRLKVRRDLAVRRLNEIDGLSCANPSGAFYAFPRIDAMDGRASPWRDDKGFVLDMLQESHVLAVHGSGFGSTFGGGHFRIVTLAPEETLNQAFDAIEKFMKRRMKKVTPATAPKR